MNNVEKQQQSTSCYHGNCPENLIAYVRIGQYITAASMSLQALHNPHVRHVHIKYAEALS